MMVDTKRLWANALSPAERTALAMILKRLQAEEMSVAAKAKSDADEVLSR